MENPAASSGSVNKLTTSPGARYLIYAIGEILLVVLGILIALQINNWNEKSKAKLTAIDYIGNIKKDLISDTLMFNSAINRVQQTIASNKEILNIEDPEAISSDSLNKILYTFHSMRVYQINNTTYLKLVSTGFLESGLFQQLIEKINSYYAKEYNAYSEYIEWDEDQSMDVFHEDFFGEYNNKIDLAGLLQEHRTEFDSTAHKKSIAAIRDFAVSNQFRNKALANYTRKQRVADRILLQKELASNLIEEIENTVGK
jgi:hypothetical protein